MDAFSAASYECRRVCMLLVYMCLCLFECEQRIFFKGMFPHPANSAQAPRTTPFQRLEDLFLLVNSFIATSTVENVCKMSAIVEKKCKDGKKRNAHRIRRSRIVRILLSKWTSEV